MRKRIFISTSTFGEYDDRPLARLKEAGLEVELNPYRRKLNGDECLKHYQDEIGVIAGTEPITKEVLDGAKGLRVISRCGTGLDNIDMDAARRLGIHIFNTPDGPTLAVAELTIGLIIDLLRRVSEMDRDLRHGKWKKKMGNLLSGKKAGIIGYGKIGKKVGELLMKLDCTVSFHDKMLTSHPTVCNSLPLEELLKCSDIICLHVSGNYKGNPLIGNKEIETMKKGAWIVNCSRGGVIDEDSLYQALETGHLAGAALDVFEEEPYSGRLIELPNVILTPHIGSYAKEARVAMETEAVENLLKGLGL